MDLVDYERGGLRAHPATSSRRGRPSSTCTTSQFIPISALHGDNVVERSADHALVRQGPSLLYHLEHVYIASDRNLIDARFPSSA